MLFLFFDGCLLGYLILGRLLGGEIGWFVGWLIGKLVASCF